MKKLTSLAIILLSVLMIASSLYAQKTGKLAQVGMAFLDIPVGTRAAAMGDAYVSVCDDANALFWNPAGMAYVENRQLIFNYSPWIADITHLSGAFALNLGNVGVVGLSFITMDYGTIPGTRIAFNEQGYELTGDLSVNDFAIGIGFARRVSNKFSFGVQVKYVSQDLGNSMTGYTADAVEEVRNRLSAPAFDFGTMFYTGFKDLCVAMSVRNYSSEVGFHEEEFPMPLLFSFGMSMDVLSLFDAGDTHKLKVAIDALHPRDYPERINFGMEYWLSNMIAVRAGYKFVTDEEGFTAGLGFNKSLGALEFRIDYAYCDFGLFQGVHRTSLSVGF